MYLICGPDKSLKPLSKSSHTETKSANVLAGLQNHRLTERPLFSDIEPPLNFATGRGASSFGFWKFEGSLLLYRHPLKQARESASAADLIRLKGVGIGLGALQNDRKTPIL